MQVLKIHPQTFKSSYIKLIALLWSLLFSLVLSIMLQVLMITRSLAVYYITNGAFSVLFGIAYLITSIVYIVIRNVRKDCKCLKVIWLVDIAYFIGGILYYLGKNFLIGSPYFIIPIPTSCDDSCLQQLQIIQPFLLGMVVVFYRFIPFFISKYYQSNLAKEHQTTEAKLQLVPEWILAAESLTLLVEFDALYNVMIHSFIQSRLSICASSIVIAAWVLWGLFVLLYTISVYYTTNIQYCRNCNVNISCVASNLGTIVALAAFGMYLLTDKLVLLGCFAGVYVPGPYAPIAWLVMKVLVLIVVITVIVLLLVYRCLSKTRQEKLLPHALYQHLHPEPDEQINELPLESVNIDEEKKEIVQIPN